MLTKGSELRASDQNVAIDKFKRDPGTGPVAEWLHTTLFRVNSKTKRLDRRARFCYPVAPFDMTKGRTK
jgi:hypothetical protein